MHFHLSYIETWTLGKEAEVLWVGGQSLPTTLSFFNESSFDGTF